MKFPAGRVAIIVGVRGERVGVLLSEVVLPRLGVLDLRIIGSVAWVALPITDIRTALTQLRACSA